MNDVGSVWRTGGYVSAIAAGVFCLYALAVRAESPPETIIIKDVPHIQQKPDFCGEACIAMCLQKLGHDVTQDDVFNIAVAKSPAGFTDADYAQARYLCYYLQEKDLLVNFYNAFIRNAKDDPSGYETLKKILNESDMDGFKKRWEKWVLSLTF